MNFNVLSELLNTFSRTLQAHSACTRLTTVIPHGSINDTLGGGMQTTLCDLSSLAPANLERQLVHGQSHTDRLRNTCGDSDVIPSATVTAAMLEVYYSIAHWPSSSLCWHQNLCRSPKKTLVSGIEVSQTLVQKIWNSLPSAFRQPGSSFAVFKQHRKSHLFNTIWDRGA